MQRTITFEITVVIDEREDKDADDEPMLVSAGERRLMLFTHHAPSPITIERHLLMALRALCLGPMISLRRQRQILKRTLRPMDPTILEPAVSP